MDLSIVTTLYYSAPYLKEFYVRSCAEAEMITNDYEVIFVNDGSPDNSLDVVLGLYEKDKKVRVIDLSRNFGHHKAMMTGLAHARGQLVFLIDCDLEEEPELLNMFYEEIKNSKADVVYGVQKIRKGGILEKITGYIYYKFFNILSSYPVPANLITARLMRHEYVKALVEHKDREIFMAGLWAITGFKQLPMLVTKYSKGSSSYNFGRKISIAINSITSFSNKPLIFIFYLGCAILLASSLAAVDLLVRVILLGTVATGWPSLIISVWLLGGLTIFCLGVVGIYISKIFTEVKQRPYTVIKKIYAWSGEGENEF